MIPSPEKLFKTRDSELQNFEGSLPSFSPHSAGYTRTSVHPYFPVAKRSFRSQKGFGNPKEIPLKILTACCVCVKVPRNVCGEAPQPRCSLPGSRLLTFVHICVTFKLYLYRGGVRTSGKSRLAYRYGVLWHVPS